MFHYRLQPLLRYRKILEEEQQRHLAAANRVYYGELEQQHHLEQQRDDYKRKLGSDAGLLQNPEMMQIYKSYFTGVEVDIGVARRRAEMALAKVEEERQKLINLVKRRRTIELHRDRLKEKYDAEEARKERIEADEMAIMRFGKEVIGHEEDEAEYNG